MDEHADGTPIEDEAGRPREGAASSGQQAIPLTGAEIADVFDRLVAAGVGALGATAQKAESLVGGSGGPRRLGDRASAALAELLDDLGLVKRERFDELELKVAQHEHRLRLLEERLAAERHPEPGAPSEI